MSNLKKFKEFVNESEIKESVKLNEIMNKDTSLGKWVEDQIDNFEFSISLLEDISEEVQSNKNISDKDKSSVRNWTKDSVKDWLKLKKSLEGLSKWAGHISIKPVKESEEKSYSDILNESLNEGKSLINLKAMVNASIEEIEDILADLNIAIESAAEADPKNEIKGAAEVIKALHKGTDLIKALKEAAKKV